MKQITNDIKANNPPLFYEKPQRKYLKIKPQMIIGFAIFTAIIVALIWVFQILLLDNFYEFIKTNEVKTAAGSLKASVLKQEELENKLYEIYAEQDISVLISDEIGTQLYLFLPNTLRISNIASLTRFDRLQLFNEISVNGGEYTENFDRVRKNGKVKSKGIIYAVTVQTEGVSRLIMLETEITPVDSTVDTLKVQLIWLTIIMVIVGLVLAVYISNHISKPIIAINKSAKVLARGNYDIRFEESGTHEVSELASTLNYAATELSKVEALRRELLANVSHDLRTPLTMIKGYSEVMRDLPGENTSENAQILVDEAARLTDLVNDLLDLSKLESGSIPLNISKFNLTESIREILKRYDKLADFSFSFENEEDVFVSADELKISQVIYNLINNAINYSLDDKRILVRQSLKGNFVKIEIVDHGEGIPGDKLRDIWERYYKVDKEHKRAQVGTGLGLSIVKNILDMHHGRYGVASEENIGSTFWFELPIDTNNENATLDISEV